MKSLKTKAWVLGTLLAFPACDSGGKEGSDKPDTGNDVGNKGGDKGSQDPKDSAGNSSSPKDDKNDSTGDDNSKDDTGEELLDCSTLEVTGFEVGQVPENLTLLAANGDKVSLHDYCNDVLLIMTGTGA